MKKCFICGKRFEKKQIDLCDECGNNPFNLERLRNKLAEIENFKTFKDTYDQKFPEIDNLNSEKFWNNKLKSIQLLKNQDGMTRERIKTACSFIPLNAKLILDIGTGFGYLEENLSQNKRFELFGCDISLDSVKNLNNRFKGNFVQKSIYQMDYHLDFFDVVFVLEIFEHIPPSRIFDVLKSVKNILKKNGILIVSVPINEGLEKMSCNHSGHVRDYTEKVILSELKLSGFVVLQVKELYAFDNFYFLKKLVSKIFTNRWKPNNLIIKVMKP